MLATRPKVLRDTQGFLVDAQGRRITDRQGQPTRNWSNPQAAKIGNSRSIRYKNVSGLVANGFGPGRVHPTTRIIFIAALLPALVACEALKELGNPTGPEEEKEEEVAPLLPEEALQALEDLGIPYSQRSFIEHAAEGDLEVVRLFIWAGMDVNIQPYTARMVLVPNRPNPTRLAHLESSWFPQEGEDNDTALMRAAGGGHLEMVRFLLENGADREIKNRQNQNAITFAAAYGHLEMVKFLVEGWYNYFLNKCIQDMELNPKANQTIPDSTRKKYRCRDLKVSKEARYNHGLFGVNLGMNWDPLIHDAVATQEKTSQT